VLEIRADKLRATIPEIGALLGEVMGIALTEPELELIATRTEGWLVGVQLLGLSLHGRPSADLLTQVRGHHRYILDYLTEEVLSRQDATIQAFLLQTCILEHLTAPLCDAVRQQAGSQPLLETLERANLFVVSLDAERRWYRYHALFADALRARLKEAEGVDLRARCICGPASGMPSRAMPTRRFNMPCMRRPGCRPPS
jgi:LuxR family maltose regulon positive regulatory protein